MIAIIGAMDEEITEILNVMDNYSLKDISGVEFYVGKLSNKDCVLTKSGIGKVNAAMSTTILFENFDIEGVVNIGTAGGMNEYEEVLDVVISDKVAHHDIDVSIYDWPLGYEQDKTCYKADDDYIKIMKEIIDGNSRVYIGNIASGDSFIYKEEQVLKIEKNFPNTLCVEMEAAGIAQVCRHYKKPFIVIRSLSDITLRKDNQITFDEYLSLASKRSALWCKKFMEKKL